MSCVILTSTLTSASNNWCTTSQKVPIKENTSICAIKIVPNHIDPSITGLVVCLSGFSIENNLMKVMDPILSNDSIREAFAHDTGACELCFDANVGSFSVKAVFVPMKPSDMQADTEVKTYINSTFIPALAKATYRSQTLDLKDQHFPLLKEKNQIMSVSNWGDAIHYQEDIVMLVRMMLKLRGISFQDWINSDERNIYSLFRPGKIAPSTIVRFNISLEKLSLQDKINYATFLVEQKQMDLRQDVYFLERIKGKTSLTPVEQSNFESILSQYNTFTKLGAQE